MLVTREIKLNCRGKDTVFSAKVPVKLAKVFDMISEVHAERLERLEKLGGQVVEGFAFEVEWRKQAAQQATVFVQDELSVLKDMLLDTDVKSSEIPPNDVY
jgi:hypothetical protein